MRRFGTKAATARSRRAPSPRDQGVSSGEFITYGTPRGRWVIVTMVLAVDALYFLKQPAAPLRWLGAAFIYPMLFWWSAALLQWPLAAERPAEPLWSVVKKSFLLFLDNLGYVSALTVVVLLLTVLCLAGPIGWIGLTLVWAGTLAFIQTAVLRELLPKYGLLPPPPADDA